MKKTYLQPTSSKPTILPLPHLNNKKNEAVQSNATINAIVQI